MIYLLDSNACIKVLNGSSLPLVARLRGHAASEIRVSSVTRGELLYGARRSAQVSENLREFSRVPTLKIEDWEEAAP